MTVFQVMKSAVLPMSTIIQSLVIIDKLTMVKNDVSVSNNFYKAVAKKSLFERIYQAEETKSLEEFREKKNNAKRQNRSETIKAERE